VYTCAHIELRASDDAHRTKESYISAQKMVMGPACHVCVYIYVCIHRSTMQNISALTMIIEPLCIEAILCVCMREWLYIYNVTHISHRIYDYITLYRTYVHICVHTCTSHRIHHCITLHRICVHICVRYIFIIYAYLCALYAGRLYYVSVRHRGSIICLYAWIITWRIYIIYASRHA